MAPLAHTLALLAMTVATTAIKVVPLDMAWNSFDDQYRGCGPAMTAALPALKCSEFQKNPLFARVWEKAKAGLQGLASPLSPPDQAIAITAYTMPDLFGGFNVAMSVARRFPRLYRDKFHYKTLHFLLTDALAMLRDAQKGQCLDVASRVCGTQYQARRGDTVRFGLFVLMFASDTRECRGTETLLQARTCHGAEIQHFAQHLQDKVVLIPPFETFEVTQVTQEGNQAQIRLRSSGTFSKYNCEWLKGGSVSLAPFHLRGLLLATTALAVATRIL